MKGYRRTNYLVAKKFQLKFVGLILIFMFCVAFFTALTIYYQIWMLLGEKLANVYPQGRLVEILKQANWGLFLRILLISPLVIILGIVLSHRIAGPIYRIRDIMDRVAAGEYNLRIFLRKTDELKDMAESINKVVEVLENKSKDK